MRIRFDPDASDDLDRVFAWIAKDNPRAASEMIARIESKVMRLAIPELTHMGRPGPVTEHPIGDATSRVGRRVTPVALDRSVEVLDSGAILTFDQVRLAERISADLRRRIERHGG